MRHLCVFVALVAGCGVPDAPARVATSEGAERPREVGELLLGEHMAGTRRCVLRTSESGFALGLPLVSAVNPRPEPSADLSPRIARAPDGFSLFTLYGRFGAGELPLTSITRHAPPLGPIAAVYLTRAGVHLTPSPRSEAQGPVPLERVHAALAEAGVGASHLVAVVPSADATETALAWTLAALDALGAEPTLALPLPEGTRGGTMAGPTTAGTCGELAEPARVGELPLSAIAEGVAPLVEAARACRSRSATYEAARGGTVRLLLRVGEDGRVERACIEEDTVGDSSLGACVIDHAKGLRFEPPVPSGSVDVRLPLRFPRDERERAEGVCASP